MDSDEEDFVFFGTPIEREEDMTSQRKKSVAEAAGQLRSLPPWKHEVRDEEGRRGLHGALTGGLSAGYYNTVGSKEGWTPQSFTSSRKCRAEIKQQNIFNFLDDDERAEMEDQSLGTSSQFDTFGFTAAEITRKQVENDQQKSREENQTRKKPPPAPQLRSKIDSLIFKSDFVKGTKVEETVAPNRDAFTASNSDALCISEEVAEKDNKFELEVENVERPVDLYKAIFSDDSDNEGEETILNHVKKDSPKKIEEANTTLNRLIAGDFLESLGKELGLEVPSGMPYSIKARGPAPPKERPNEKPYEEETALESGLLIDESVHGNLPKSGSILINRGFSENKSDEVNLEKIAQENSKAKAPSSRKHNWSSSSSSDYEISRKWSRRRRHRSRDSDSASSSDNRDRYHSRSKGSKKKSSREKSSSRRKHSKHHKHSSRDSLSRSRHSTENELAEDRREKRNRGIEGEILLAQFYLDIYMGRSHINTAH